MGINWHRIVWAGLVSQRDSKPMAEDVNSYFKRRPHQTLFTSSRHAVFVYMPW